MSAGPKRDESAPSRRAEFAALAVVLLALGIPKLVLTAMGSGTSIDGGYYTDVASHVRDGEGLVSNVSLYHHGYSDFPHGTAIYPLWPLIYGTAGRFFPLIEVGRWLATLFYFGALGFAFAWGRALSPRRLFPGAVPGVHLGHVLVAVLGFHREFFEFTSLPYTEGLGWCVLMAGLWRSTSVLARPTLAGAVELGVWCGLAFLARSQMVIFAGASALAVAHLVFWDREQRSRWMIFAAVWLASTLAVIAPHAIHVASLTDVSLVHALLRFDAAAATDGLSPVKMLVEERSLGSALAAYGTGVVEAFSWRSNFSYRKVFYWFHFALPLMLIVLGWIVAKRGRREELASQVRRSFGGAGSGPAVLALCICIIGFVSIHLLHKQYYLAWNFTRRQGLTAGLAFAFCIWLLATRRQALPRFLGLFCLLAGASTGYIRVSDLAYKAAQSEPRPHRPTLVKWLQAQADAKGKLVVAMSAQEPQLIAPHTKNVGYHWFHHRTKPRDLKVMVEELGVSFVVVGTKARKWKSVSSVWFESNFEPLGGPVAGFYIYGRKGHHDGLTTPPRRR